MEVNNTFCKIIKLFWRKKQSLNLSLFAKPVPLFSSWKVYMRFFSYAFFNRQVSDCDGYFQISNFVWKLFESLLSLYKQRYFGEVSLSLICMISVLPFTRSKIVEFKENLAVIASLNHSGYFGRNFHRTEFPLTISIQYQLERYKMMGFKGLNI